MKRNKNFKVYETRVMTVYYFKYLDLYREFESISTYKQVSNPSVKRSSGLVQFTLKVFSLVTIENDRAIILGPRDVTFPCPFGAENRQLFARVCARSIAPSVVLSMICD